MNRKKIITAAMSLALGFGGVAFAADYYAPERLMCKLDMFGKLSCADFNRAYLVEHTYTADFPATNTMTFSFATGTAYQTNNEWVVFYTYKNSFGKNVTLKSTSVSIKPNLKVGAWKMDKNIYTCEAGYMSCPITDLSV